MPNQWTSNLGCQLAHSKATPRGDTRCSQNMAQTVSDPKCQNMGFNVQMPSATTSCLLHSATYLPRICSHKMTQTGSNAQDAIMKVYKAHVPPSTQQGTHCNKSRPMPRYTSLICRAVWGQANKAPVDRFQCQLPLCRVQQGLGQLKHVHTA